MWFNYSELIANQSDVMIASTPSGCIIMNTSEINSINSFKYFIRIENLIPEKERTMETPKSGLFNSFSIELLFSIIHDLFSVTYIARNRTNATRTKSKRFVVYELLRQVLRQVTQQLNKFDINSEYETLHTMYLFNCSCIMDMNGQWIFFGIIQCCSWTIWRIKFMAIFHGLMH